MLLDMSEPDSQGEEGVRASDLGPSENHQARIYPVRFGNGLDRQKGPTKSTALTKTT